MEGQKLDRDSPKHAWIYIASILGLTPHVVWLAGTIFFQEFLFYVYIESPTP